MLTRIWILFLPATLEQTHYVDVIGGPSGLGDGHILPDWREQSFSPMTSRKATLPVRTACKGARLHPASGLGKGDVRMQTPEYHHNGLEGRRCGRALLFQSGGVPSPHLLHCILYGDV